jgi:PilZ domain
MSKVEAESLYEAHEYYADDLFAAASHERRRVERKSIAIRATVTVPGWSVLPGHTVDLSRAGASITVPFDLAQGQECLIDLELHACGAVGAFHIPAEVRYCVQVGRGRYRIGMRFGQMNAATIAFIEAILNAPLIQ